MSCVHACTDMLDDRLDEAGKFVRPNTYQCPVTTTGNTVSFRNAGRTTKLTLLQVRIGNKHETRYLRNSRMCAPSGRHWTKTEHRYLRRRGGSSVPSSYHACLLILTNLKQQTCSRSKYIHGNRPETARIIQIYVDDSLAAKTRLTQRTQVTETRPFNTKPIVHYFRT